MIYFIRNVYRIFFFTYIYLKYNLKNQLFMRKNILILLLGASALANAQSFVCGNVDENTNIYNITPPLEFCL